MDYEPLLILRLFMLICCTVGATVALMSFLERSLHESGLTHRVFLLLLFMANVALVVKAVDMISGKH